MTCKTCNQPVPVEASDRHYCCAQDMAQQKRIAELERYASDLKEIVKAVAHVGVDFGYGEYELDSQTIEKARFLLGGEALGDEE